MGLLRVSEIKLSLNELEILTGFNSRVLKNRLHSIIPERGEQNATLYPLKAAVDAIYKEDTSNLAALKLQREREETRLAAARATKVEFDNAERDRTLIPFEEAEKRYAELVINFKQRLLAIPTKSAFEVIQLKTPQQAEDYLKTQIAEAINELTRRLRQQNTQPCRTSSESNDQSVGG